jgi:hypothetical protein
MIQEEWEESLRQMEVVLSIIIMPFFGKWYGRRWAYWGECREPNAQRPVPSAQSPEPRAQCPEPSAALRAPFGRCW